MSGRALSRAERENFRAAVRLSGWAFAFTFIGVAILTYLFYLFLPSVAPEPTLENLLARDPLPYLIASGTAIFVAFLIMCFAVNKSREVTIVVSFIVVLVGFLIALFGGISIEYLYQDMVREYR